MKKVSLRAFIREYNDYLPPPPEGIKVVRRGSPDFFIYPFQVKGSNVSQVEIPEGFAEQIADLVIEKAEALRASKRKEEEYSQSTSSSYQEGRHCDAKQIMPWESACQSRQTERVLIASLENGTPMSEDDWKEFSICSLHRKLLEQLGGFEIEDVE
jgi:hypothetical protein